MKVVAWSGGVGGAKLSLGLYKVLAPHEFTVIVNTGDDFDHLGLRICPDLDTTLYTLADVAHPAQGWGRRDETWTAMRTLAALGEETWFQLGDADAALHLARTQRLRDGATLSDVMRAFTDRFGIAAEIVPMSDAPVATVVVTEQGELPFQRYFVEQQCRPAVRGLRFEGAEHASPAPAAERAFQTGNVDAIVLCPSNPYLSIDPMLAIPGLRNLLARRQVPAVAVSPLIGRAAVKGPTAKIMRELGLEVSNHSIARHYEGLIDALVIDPADTADVSTLPVPAFVHPTLMDTLGDRTSLAGFVLQCATHLARQ